MDVIPTAQSWVGRLLRLPLRLVPPMREMRIVTGPLAGRRWLSGSAPHGCWLGTYERELQDVMCETVRAGDVVFDVGANVGFFTLLASQLVGPSGRVMSFEPLPRNLELLRRHVELNRLANVEIVAAAVADEPGEALFETGPAPSMAHLGATGTPVRVVAIDELVESGATPPPRVIKMDIEGAEARALAGAQRTLRTHRPVILLSTHGIAQHTACWALLQEWGYTPTLRRDGTADGQYELVARPS